MMYTINRTDCHREGQEVSTTQKEEYETFFMSEPTKYSAVEQKEESSHSSQEQFGTEMRYLQALLKQIHRHRFCCCMCLPNALTRVQVTHFTHSPIYNFSIY